MPSLRDVVTSIGRASIEDPKYPLTSSRLLEVFGAKASEAGEMVSPKGALSVIAFYRAVCVIAGTGAGVPLHAYQKDEDDNRLDVTDNYPVMIDPHPEMTPFELFEWMYSSVETAGNAFLQKIRFVDGNEPGPGGKRPIRYLYPIRQELVRVGRASDGTKWFEIRNPDTGEITPATTNDILHIPGLAYDGVVGLSPVDLARQGIGIGLATDKFAGSLFNKGGLISGILQTDRRLPPGGADKLQEQWQKMTSGAKNAHSVAVLDQGAKYQPIQLSPEAMQFLETRKYSVIEMARLTGVPPHLLMETSAASNWGTGIEEQTRGFITFSLSYRLKRVAGRFTKELLPVGTYAEHITQGLLSLDTIKRYQGYSLALRDKWMLIEETRRAENLKVDPATMAKLAGLTEQAQPNEVEAEVEAVSGEDPEAIAAAAETVQAQALNGAQIASLLEIVSAVAAGELPADSAKEIILVSFPLLDDATVDKIISPVESFVPAAPTAPAPTTEEV